MKKNNFLDVVFIFIAFFLGIICYSQTKNNETIVDEFYLNTNENRIKNKIIVYKNFKTDLDFEQNHFMLPIKIYKEINNSKYKLWYSNDLLINKNDSNCVSEGYSNIVIKNNFFTIESQSCYDYQILVSIYMTFKIIKNKIYLHKYSEEYFDKTNHENKIPSKTLTNKDFGKIEFDKVNINNLSNLILSENK